MTPGRTAWCSASASCRSSLRRPLHPRRHGTLPQFSALMAGIPAKIAGVERIVIATPPEEDGSIPDVMLAAAKIAGITDIIKLGGAQAVAALAYGTQSVPRVDKIVGPGNIYVTTAKQLCSPAKGAVAIDTIAGPSEILVDFRRIHQSRPSSPPTF